MDLNAPGLDDAEVQGSVTSADESSQPPITAMTDTPPVSDESDEMDAAQANQTELQADGTEPQAEASEPQADVSEPQADVPEPVVSTAADTLTKPGTSLKKYTLVEGTVMATSPTSVTIDVGGIEGIIPSNELEKMTRSTLDALRPGEKVTVFVVNDRDHLGRVVLSVNRAMEELDWKRAEEYRQSQQVYETRVAGYNKGGLIVRFGRVRGFVPQSQMNAERRQLIEGSDTPEDRWGKMVNEPISVKVMEVDRARNRLILSERSAYRETREKRKENLINQLEVGEIRAGRVVSLEDFGAFVDIGGAEGLVHLTELSWKHVNHPREVLSVNQAVKVKVISIDRDNKRIGLSMKQQEPDPWDVVATSYGEGQLVQGVVTKLTKFGAFARLVEVPEIEGLIHISELSDKRVTHPREVVNEGDKLTLRVVKVNIKERRLGLSLKKVNSAEYLDLDWANNEYEK